ncbi:unnamed protein product [Peronospora farinosa]|uniref:Telomere replication protein EST3 n=1 Tax=Peronospora farinosa TaxID=134698 RepID=A0AAV0SVA7_9STRA|nr:unnamed protein product [Peronospora farinosa]CAI5708605.1 unnamed protein product [Peronospora farinosa]
MWIPAGRLTAEHNIHEVLESLAADSQPAVWRESRAHLRDFNRILNQGISFFFTSDDALRRLDGVQLSICDTVVTIRKYSSYDKLYFVDLQRLPADVADLAIYDWFVARGAPPILITPTQAQGELKSRARTIYFNSVSCPVQLFEHNGEPLRKIFFFEEEKPCFVQRRLCRYNRVKPPSLRPPPRPTSEFSDTNMQSDEGDVSPGDLHATASPSQATLLSATVRTPPQPDSGRTQAPLSQFSSSHGTSSHPASTSSPIDKTFILGSVSTDDPTWKLV